MRVLTLSFRAFKTFLDVTEATFLGNTMKTWVKLCYWTTKVTEKKWRNISKYLIAVSMYESEKAKIKLMHERLNQLSAWADNWEWRPIAFGQHLQVISGKLRNLTTYSPTSNYGRLYIKLSRNIKNLNFIYSIPFFAFDKLGRFFIGMNNFDTKLCLNYIALGQISVKTGNSCISLHKCILDSPRSTIYLCCAFVKIDTKFE